MGPGHFGIGFAAKSVAPKAPLWVLLSASEIYDLLFFILWAVGIEKKGIDTTDFTQGLQIVKPGYIPWSHGLFMCLIWAFAAAVIAFLFYRDRRTSIAIGLIVFSHWALDFIVHPGLPIWFNSLPLVGLSLWTSGPGYMIAIVLEFMLLIAGIVIYVLARKRKLNQFTASK